MIALGEIFILQFPLTKGREKSNEIPGRNDREGSCYGTEKEPYNSKQLPPPELRPGAELAHQQSRDGGKGPGDQQAEIRAPQRRE